ncbi:caffeoyl-CoA O-methyltransferase [Tanacetum coccineum]
MTTSGDEEQFLNILLKLINAKNTMEIGVCMEYLLLSTALAFPEDGKDNYLIYHKRLIDLVKVGGMIGYDNTLWNGSLGPPADAPLKKYVRYYKDFMLELNKALAVDPRAKICQLRVGMNNS